MKINVKLDLSDGERDILADYIDKADTYRMATRKDVNAFVNGCIDAALASPLPIENTEEEEIERLQKIGFNDNYIRGWLQVGRAV